jgi:hypothetical protein
MTKEIIEFELNIGWKKCLRVCAVQNHVLHKDKQCIPSSKVERIGLRMIRESLDQRKSYPMNSCERTKEEVMEKWEVHFVQKCGKLTPSKLSAAKAWLGDWDCI